MAKLSIFERITKGSEKNNLREDEINEKFKKECSLRLSQFFRVPIVKLKDFNFDGKDNIKDLTKALKSTSDKGTELYYNTVIKLVKEDLG